MSEQAKSQADPKTGAAERPEGKAKEPAGKPPAAPEKPAEVGGRDGPEPTRYGDWEVKGICVDF